MSRTRSMWRAVLAAALWSAAGCAGLRLAPRAHGPGHAATVVAARSFDEGVEAYGRGDLSRAQRAFERAYAAAPTPEVLYNLARVREAMGDAPAAGRYYIAYARQARAMPPAQRAETDAALARIRRRTGWLVVRAPDGIGVTIEGEVLSDVLRGAPVAVWPGVRTVRAGAAAPVAVQLRVGDTVALDFGHPSAMVLISVEPARELRADTLLDASTEP